MLLLFRCTLECLDFGTASRVEKIRNTADGNSMRKTEALNELGCLSRHVGVQLLTVPLSGTQVVRAAVNPCSHVSMMMFLTFPAGGGL